MTEQALAKVESQTVVPMETAHEQKEVMQTVEKYRGISQEAVTQGQAVVLMAPVEETDVEIRPDGIIYLPEIKYRRRLNQAFAPGGWALMPTSKFDMRDNTIMRQYALYVGGRFISEAVGEQEYIQSNPNMTYATAAEGCKSNALMRCCKDLGIASELWDPGFIAPWIAKCAIKVWNTKKSKFEFRRKDRDAFWWEKKDQKATDDKAEPAHRPNIEQPPPPTDEQPPPPGDPNPAPSNSAPPPADPQLISDPQRKRMYAIARGAGLNDTQFKAELEKMGFKSSKDVTRESYEDICAHFEGMKA